MTSHRFQCLGNRQHSPQYFPRTRLQFTILPEWEYGHGLGMPAGSVSLGRINVADGRSLWQDDAGAGSAVVRSERVVGGVLLA